MGSARDEIAIVGMSCRFPGSTATPEDFWRILKAGDDVVTRIDSNRWGVDYFLHPNSSVPGKSYTFAAGVLKDIDKFDADFFGISPREAAQMDPQQRILLELAWEALENGGQNTERVAGSDCAVYVGISSTDYATRRLDDPSSGDAYFMTGGTLSIAANRISYFLDLHGPSLAIDTACSSSLVALHHACQGLWRGEYSSAIAGGVNMLLTPYPFIGFCKASMLSPDGRCRAFDADGNGYVRAEGGGLLYLKLRRKAEADGDPIHALIVGSGVNCDGRSRGLSMPRADMQEALLREVYQNFDVDPKKLSYVEAHGTGTAAGDPQEAAAIGRALGSARDANDPLLIGSAKTNVGHLESAAGMAGLVKVVMSLKHRTIPASLFFETPNPNIPFDELNLRVVTDDTDLPDNGEPAIMGVNSFGFGGANAHLVLKEYSPAGKKKEPSQAAGLNGSKRRPGIVPLFLSARSEPALKDLAARYQELLSDPKAPAVQDVAHAAATRRQQHEHRLAVFGRDAAEITRRLETFSTAGRGDGIVSGRTVGRPARLALLFSGNGSQWQGMGRRLLATDQIFRRHVKKVDELLRPLAGFSVIDELNAEPSESRLHLTEVAQPLLFALQVGLYESLIARGLEVGAVCGHSVGEVAAAYAAGAFDLETAVRVIHERSAVQALTRGQGRMAAVGLPSAEVLDEIAKYDGDIELAAINSPSSVTLSGSLLALEALKVTLEARGVFFRMLDLDYAFHSRVMDVVRDPLLQALDGLKASALRYPLASTVTGTMIEPDALGADYWWDNIRCPVRFDAALANLIEQGFKVFLEVGPHPIMQNYVNENLRAAKSSGMSVVTLKRNADDQVSLWEALCGVHTFGCPLDVKKLFPGRSRYVALPLYPWQRELHWHSTTNETRRALGPGFDHPLLGYRYDETEWLWENQLDVERVPYLADHVVGGAPVFPGSAFIEMALAAAEVRSPGTSHELEFLEVRAPLVFDGTTLRMVRFKLNDDGSFAVSSRPRLIDQAWTVHAVGQLSSPSLRPVPPPVDVTRVPDEGAERFSSEDHYRFTKLIGLTYGPAFRGLREAHCTGDKVFARIQLQEPVAADASRYLLHPGLLDSCLQVLVELCAADVDLRRPVCFLPVRAGRVVYFRRGGRAVYCRAEIEKRSPRAMVARFQILDEAGETVAILENFRFRSARLVREGGDAPAQYLFRPVLKSRHEDDASDSLPRPADLASCLANAAKDERHQHRRAELHDEVLPLFDALVSAFAYRALEELLGGEKRFTLASLMATASIDASHAPLLSRLVGMLEEDGVIVREDSELRLAESAEHTSPEEIWRLVLAEFPGYVTEATLVGRHGLHLAALLRAAAPGDVLASRNGVGDAAVLSDASPAWQLTNHLVKEALCEIVRGWPPGRSLRILELSNGAVGLAADLLTVLPKERCSYVIASPDEAVRANAQAALADLPGHSVSELDINGDLGEQQVAAGSFDVVIASHVLHRSDNPAHALDNIRGLLGRNALLLLLERAPDRQSDLVFGAQPDWWLRTVDADRPVSPLRSADEWRGVLERRGFADVTLPEPAPDLAASSYLLIARNPEATIVEAQPAATANQRYLVLADQHGDSAVIAEHVIEQLRADGHQPIRVNAGRQFARLGEDQFVVSPENAADFGRLFDVLGEENKDVTEIVHLMGLSLAADGPHTDLQAVQQRRCTAALHLLHAVSRDEIATPPRLWLVAAGASAVAPTSTAPGVASPIPSQAPIWGFGRVLMNEYPELQCRMIDLYADEQADIAGPLVMAELRDPDDEDEVLVSPGNRYGLRLNRVTLDRPPVATQAAESSRTRLDFVNPGLLSNLRWFEDERPAPKAGEIEIRVRATGLNFRDVMFSMGLLSEEAVEDGFAGPTLGLECAGDVVRVGDGVTDFKVGDAVMCFGRACFASHVITKTTSVARIPSGWSYEEAATVPCVFFTVYYSLKRLAGLQRGERVLIHGAAGGVGLAAIQYARLCGAEIFATAGSEKKRDFLRLIGVDHVLDSRSLAFADEIMAITGGVGVDVVLNSLSGEAVAKNFAVLRPFGRFLELGKRDFYENAKVGLRPFRNNISYFGIDADQLMMERPDLAGQLFREMMALFDEGAFRPLAHRVFPGARVADAFRHMQQSDHIGKIVLSYDDPVEAIPAVAPVRRERELKLDPEGSYLISGGLGGFGLATARWMVAKGARTIVLMGRSGAATPEAYAGIAELEAAGARIHVYRADVAQLDDLRRVFKRIDRDLPPLKGVVHAAMVLEDTLVRNMDRESLQRVLAPKMLGAWHLHQLTRELPLDLFVLYSSATTSFGNPSQANYVAGNMYLESLAHYRRSLGLPAIAVGWGPLGDVGFLVHNEKVRDALLARIGGKELSSAQALLQLERLLEADLSGVAVVDLDWRRLKKLMPGTRSTKFGPLGGPAGEGGDAVEEDIHALIANLSEDEVLETVTELLLQQMANVLRMPVEKIAPDASIYDLGMDSLMAFELHTAIEDRFRINVPITSLTEGATTGQIAGRIAAQLSGNGASAEPSQPDQQRDALSVLIARHGETPGEEEVDAFVDRLSRVGGAG